MPDAAGRRWSTWWVPMAAVIEADSAEEAYERVWTLLTLVGEEQMLPPGTLVIGPREHVRGHQ